MLHIIYISVSWKDETCVHASLPRVEATSRYYYYGRRVRRTISIEANVRLPEADGPAKYNS